MIFPKIDFYINFCVLEIYIYLYIFYAEGKLLSPSLNNLLKRKIVPLFIHSITLSDNDTFLRYEWTCGFKKKFLIDLFSSPISSTRCIPEIGDSISRVFPIRGMPQPCTRESSSCPQIESIDPIDIAEATTAARLCARTSSSEEEEHFWKGLEEWEGGGGREREKKRVPRESRKWIVFRAVINLSFDVRQKFIAEPRWRTISASILYARWGKEGDGGEE